MISKESLEYCIPPKLGMHDLENLSTIQSLGRKSFLTTPFNVHALFAPVSWCPNVQIVRRTIGGFLIFNLSGAPTWCIVMSDWCGLCNTRFNGNDDYLFASLPPHIWDAYPVEPHYASISITYHVHKSVIIFIWWLSQHVLKWHHISKCLYWVMNEEYKYRVTHYFSLWSEAKKHSPALYVDGQKTKILPSQGWRFCYILSTTKIRHTLMLCWCGWKPPHPFWG